MLLCALFDVCMRFFLGGAAVTMCLFVLEFPGLLFQGVLFLLGWLTIRLNAFQRSLWLGMVCFLYCLKLIFNDGRYSGHAASPWTPRNCFIFEF